MTRTPETRAASAREPAKPKASAKRGGSGRSKIHAHEVTAGCWWPTCRDQNPQDDVPSRFTDPHSGIQRSEPRRCALCGHDRSEEDRTIEQSVVNCPETGSLTDGEHDNKNNIHVRGMDGLSAWPTFALATASWYGQCPKPETFSRSARLEACLCGPTSASSHGDGAPTFRSLSTDARAKCD